MEFHGEAPISRASFENSVEFSVRFLLVGFVEILLEFGWVFLQNQDIWKSFVDLVFLDVFLLVIFPLRFG